MTTDRKLNVFYFIGTCLTIVAVAWIVGFYFGG